MKRMFSVSLPRSLARDFPEVVSVLPTAQGPQLCCLAVDFRTEDFAPRHFVFQEWEQKALVRGNFSNGSGSIVLSW